MSASSQPAQGRRQAFLPRCGIVHPSGYLSDFKLPSILPSLGSQDRSEIAMVRLVALVESHSPVVGVESDIIGEDGPLFQIPQQWRVQRGGFFQSFEGSRETTGSPEDFRMVEQGAEGRHRIMTRTSNPPGGWRIKQSQMLRKSTRDCDRIHRDTRRVHFSRDYFRQYSLAVKSIDRSASLQSGRQHQEEGEPPFKRLAIGRRQKEGELCALDRDGFGGFRHRQSVTFPNSFSNT